MNEILFFIREEPYGFLSNFERTPFKVDGKIYPTNEHYYQSQKPTDEWIQEWIRYAPNATLAMVMGRQLEHNDLLKKYMKPDWESGKLEVMLKGLRHKFSVSFLGVQLLRTGDAVIHENNPDDPYWGLGNGTGESWLGKLLMQIRSEIPQTEAEIRKRLQLGEEIK